MPGHDHIELPTDVEGGCHCGAVRYRITLRSLEAVECNCSVCTMKGFVHHFVARPDFTLLRGAEALTTYRFNTGVAQHHFCATCGIHSFYVARSHPDDFDVNVRCLDAPWPDRFRAEPFDGRNWEENIGSIR